MSRMVIIKERCKGCLLCTTVCPKNIIGQAHELNAQGYQIAEVSNMDECTGCGSCAIICPDLAIRVFAPEKKAKVAS